MKIYPKDDFILRKEELVKQIKEGSVFIYPTDTLYGIGCNAELSEPVTRIRNLKQHEGPFSVIAPSKGWIIDNCDEPAEEHFNKLPGPYTLILNLKNKDCIAPETNLNADTLGIRVPDHWFSSIAQELEHPIITTSVNRSGKSPIHAIKDIPDNFKHVVDFAIDEGMIKNSPSTLIDLTQKQPRITKR